MIWMYSPALTSYASAVARSTRKSSRGSASGARQLDLLRPARGRPPDLDQQRRRRPVAVDHPAAGRARRPRPRRARRRTPPLHRAGWRRRTAAVPVPRRAPGPARAGWRGSPRMRRPRAGPGGRSRRRRRGSRAPPRPRRPRGRARSARDLPAVVIDHRQLVAGLEPDRGCGPGPHPVGLQRAVDRPQAGQRERRAHGDGHGQAPAAGPVGLALGLSTSSSASSRLAAGSSFLTSFSTTLRL